MTTPPITDTKRGVLRAIVRRIRRLVRPDVAGVIAGALDRQRWVDTSEHVSCGSCGGLGVVADYSNRLPAEHYGGQPGNHVYGGKICPDCKGRGF